MTMQQNMSLLEVFDKTFIIKNGFGKFIGR